MSGAVVDIQTRNSPQSFTSNWTATAMVIAIQGLYADMEAKYFFLFPFVKDFPCLHCVSVIYILYVLLQTEFWTRAFCACSAKFETPEIVVFLALGVSVWIAQQTLVISLTHLVYAICRVWRIEARQHKLYVK